MFPAAMCPVQIKDLKDLRALLCRRVTIDMQDLKDLKRCFHAGRAIAGDRPPRYGEKGPEEIFSRGRSRGKPARLRVWHARAPALR